MKWYSWQALALVGVALVSPFIALIVLAPVLPGPIFFLTLVIGAWVFDSMIQLRWMHQRELAMALGVTMRRNAPILPVLEGNPLVEKPPLWKEILAWVFPYPFYAPIFAWRFGLRAVLLRAIEKARAGNPAALLEPGLLHSDDLLDIQMDRLVPGLDPSRVRGGRLRSELAQAMVQLVYPILVVLFTLSVANFWLIYIAPKIRRIHQDLGVPYPWLTEALEVFLGYCFPILFYLIMAAIILGVFCRVFPGFSWKIPGIGRVISTWGRGRFLESLGQLIRAGKDLPHALSQLDNPSLHGREALMRLRKLSHLVEQGIPTPTALEKAGWIDRPQEAWFGLATKSGRFGDALVELGGSLQSLSLRRLRWRAQVSSIVAILGIGAMVGFVVLAFFIPLVELMEWLGR